MRLFTIKIVSDSKNKVENEACRIECHFQAEGEGSIKSASTIENLVANAVQKTIEAALEKAKFIAGTGSGDTDQEAFDMAKLIADITQSGRK